ncbi:uncharacterized protein LOC116218591 [Clupea harengus]|uniref:Uncharacterized protein LOC116218591 n=1 Tax=Clupea harengus TaxID=7950 RepID=A0A6P8EXD2_CLUHA|nr:uncharacterized protein LOC116218591 [Clupea harengus]
MDNTEERLAEEVLRHEHLYNPSLSTHEHVQMTANSWREISASVGLDVQECIEGWGKMVDEYVFFHQMSWLDPYIEDSETSSNYDNKTESLSSEGIHSSSPESSTSAPEDSPESSTLVIPPAHRSRKRRRRMEPDQSSIADVFSMSVGRRIQLYRSFANVVPCPSPPLDQCALFGQIVGCLAKKLPKDRRRAIMCQVYSLLIKNQSDYVPYLQVNAICK